MGNVAVFFISRTSLFFQASISYFSPDLFATLKLSKQVFFFKQNKVTKFRLSGNKTTYAWKSIGGGRLKYSRDIPEFNRRRLFTKDTGINCRERDQMMHKMNFSRPEPPQTPAEKFCGKRWRGPAPDCGKENAWFC